MVIRILRGIKRRIRYVHGKMVERFRMWLFGTDEWYSFIQWSTICNEYKLLEFKKRNEVFNQQLRNLEAQLATIEAKEARQKDSALDITKIRRELEKELTFEDGINTALVATILEKIEVKKESTKNEIHLDIFLKLNTQYQAIYDPKNFSASISPSRSTMHKHPIRRI
jgi:hypothetical protein